LIIATGQDDIAYNTPPTRNVTLSNNETIFYTDNLAANALLQDPGIKAMLQSVVDSALVKNSKIPGPAGDPGPIGPAGPARIDIRGNPAKLKPDKVGYFDLSAEGEGDYITTGKYIVYRDVFAFTKRLDLLTG